MDNAEPDTELLKRLAEGDPLATGKLFACYAQRLTRLAEQHLSRKVKGREDGEDVVQSVFRTFFRRSSRGEFQIDDSNQLWRLLVKMTLLKARARGRRHTAEMRDVRAEKPGGDAWLHAALTHEPGPAEAAALLDQITALLRGLPALFGEVLERRLRGQPVAEIAQELRVSRQSVYRVLQVLQQRLQRSAQDGKG
jgi:RNA polymerase sigma-70 factor (ECF subfamily)